MNGPSSSKGSQSFQLRSAGSDFNKRAGDVFAGLASHNLSQASAAVRPPDSLNDASKCVAGFFRSRLNGRASKHSPQCSAACMCFLPANCSIPARNSSVLRIPLNLFILRRYTHYTITDDDVALDGDTVNRRVAMDFLADLKHRKEQGTAGEGGEV